MTALSKLLVLLAIFLLENSGDSFMNLISAAGNLAWINHLIQFVEPMSKPTNEPTVEPTNELMIERTNNQKNVRTNEHRYENYLQPLRFSDELKKYARRYLYLTF